jgi:hypothetical protein
MAKKQKPKRPKAKKQKAKRPNAKTHPKTMPPDRLEAILNVLNMLIDHADRVASRAQIGALAARDLLVSKGIITDAAWDAAVDRVERGQATLFALDPDVQRAVDEIRGLLDPAEPNGGAPEEGGEA